MKEAGTGTILAACAPSTIALFGEMPEIEGALASGLRVVRVASVAELQGATVAVVVVDLRTHPAASLSAARGSPELAGVPALVVSATEVDDAVLDALDASDVLVLPARAQTLERRLRTLVELGQIRFSMAVTDQVLAHAVTGLTVVDAGAEDLPLVYVSPAFERLTGYTAAQCLGRNCRFLQGDERDQPGTARLHRAVEGRSRDTVVLQNFKSDGTPFWNEVSVFPITVQGREARYLGGIQHEVTLLHEAKSEVDFLYGTLLDQQTFDQAILDGVAVGIVTTDANGSVTFANRAAHRMLRRETDAAGTHVCALLGLKENPQQLLGTELQRALSYEVVTADGATLEVDLSVTRSERSSDERVGFFFIFRDAHEERQFEIERRRFERLVAMGTMVAGFAHEVRNPVAALRSIAEEVAEELLAAGITIPHTGRMLQILDRIERLVRASLQFGHPAAPRRARHRPWAILSTAVAEVGPRTRAAGDELRIEVEPELPDVYCDEAQIAQALSILLNNALDAVGLPRRVLLRATRHKAAAMIRPRGTPPPPSNGSWVRLEVCDDGPGVAPDIVSRIFDPFFTTKAAGTGLGLSIAQQVVSENRGRLEVASTRGGPTVFTILVPAEP